MQYIELRTPKSYILSYKCLRFIKDKKIDYIYTREPRLLFFIQLYNKLFFHLKYKIIYEAHTMADGSKTEKIIEKIVSKSVNYLILITNYLKENYPKVYNCKQAKILVSPDAVDLAEFDINISQDEARKKLGLPQDRQIVLYTGHLYKWKGVDTLIEASRLLDKNILIYIVGGIRQDVEAYQAKYADYANVKFAGHKPHQEIPFWLKAADVLVLPNSGKEKISLLYTSPLKMFEYMASKRPMVASDLPSLREILNESNCLFCHPDDPGSLADSLKKVFEDKELADQISQQAFRDVDNYTWEKRVESVLDFIR